MTDFERPATLSVRAPDGADRGVVELRTPRVSVGRPVPGSCPDVPLEPDPGSWVSRLHCFIENDRGTWYVTDNAAKNGTFLQSDAGERERVTGRRRLESGDVISVLGALDADGPRYWNLTFIDPWATNGAEQPQENVPPWLDYDWNQAKLFRVEGRTRVEISLPGHGHKLIRHFVARSRQNGGTPVACTHDELVRAVWGGPETWELGRAFTRENLRDLVCDVRRLVEPNPARPCVLVTVTGHGYRLVTCPPESGGG